MNIAIRRRFILAAQVLANTSNPKLEHYKAVTDALADLATENTGVPCTVAIQCNAKDLAKALGEIDERSNDR